MNGFGFAGAFPDALIVALLCVEAVLALIALISLARKHLLQRYKSLAVILALMFLANAFGLVIRYVPLSHLFYKSYFYSYWLTEAVELILMLVFCSEVLKRMFSSLPELQSLSMRIFRWVLILGIALSAVLVFLMRWDGPRLLAAEVIQLQRLEEFVAFFTAVVVFASMRTLGFEPRTRLFGFSLGLVFSVLSVGPTFLADEVRMKHPQSIAILVSVAICAQLVSWIAALSWPEPVRHVVSV
jgi:hypothetical protein